jgi:predicted CXXCH cytochrome family protein
MRGLPPAARLGQAVILTKRPDRSFATRVTHGKANFQKAHQHTALKDAGPTKLGCVGCHDPHASAVKGLLKRTGNDLCFTCHKREQFAGKVTHAVVAQDCRTCHDPHASAQADILARPAKALCQQCHDPQEARLVKAHSDYSVRETECTSCHAPHASDRAKLVRRFEHTAMAQMGCGACHAEPTSTRPFGVTAEGSALCFTCHADKEKAFKQKAIHDPVKAGQCTLCHSPHATDFKGSWCQRKGHCVTCQQVAETLKARRCMPARTSLQRATTLMRRPMRRSNIFQMSYASPVPTKPKT